MPSGVTREMIKQPFGPGYRVYEAQTRWGPESKGWVVESVATGKFVWTGGYMTIREAFERLRRIET
jgi:hypothetical protein